MKETIYTSLLESFLASLKISPKYCAYLLDVPEATVEDWKSGLCPIPYANVRKMDECIREARARTHNFGSAGYEEYSRKHLEETGFDWKLKRVYDSLGEN